MVYTDLKHYEIDRLKIEWGKTLDEVRPLLNQFEKLAPEGYWNQIRCKCSSAFGLPASEFTVIVSFEGGPVSLVQYVLAPIKSESFETLHLPYLESLEKNFGKPFNSKQLYKRPPLGKKYLSTIQVFNATWLFDNACIDLIVYGGPRNGDNGLYGATVSIKERIKVVKASKPLPLRERSEDFERIISENINNGMVLRKFEFESEQSPSEKSFDKQTMFQTPEKIQNQLKENEVGLYKVEPLNMTFISNKWDTIFLIPGDGKKLIFYDFLPARGRGSYTLKLGEMSFGASRKSSVLLDLVHAVEEATGLTIAKEQYLDE